MMNDIISILYQYIQLVSKLIFTNESIGASIFIIIVLLWYSACFVFLLRMQTRKSAEVFDDFIKHPTKLFVQNQCNNQEILSKIF